MARNFVQVLKDQPSEEDVHVPNAGAGQGTQNGKRRTFQQVIAETTKHESDMRRLPIGKKRDLLKLDDWVVNVYVNKLIAPKRLIFGWANIVEKDGKVVVDSQGDWIDAGDLEEAFYLHAERGGVAGFEHRDFGDHIGKLVECMVFTKEKQAALNIDLGLVGAWVGYRVNQQIFDKVNSGEYRAFSIGGTGHRI